MTRTSIHPAWGLVEVAALSALFVFTLWIVGPQVQTSAAALAEYWAAVAVFTLTVIWLSPIALHHDPPSLRGWGLGRRASDPGTLRNAWSVYAVATALMAAALMIAVAVRDPGFAARTNWPRVGAKFLIYAVYGSIQALVFFGWLQTRLRTAVVAFGARRWRARLIVAVGVASLFGAAHAPNWPLAVLALGVGLVWSWLYYARPNLILMGMSHAVLGTIVYSLLGLYTRIGPFYAHPEGHIARYAIPGLRPLVGDLF